MNQAIDMVDIVTDVSNQLANGADRMAVLHAIPTNVIASNLEALMGLGYDVNSLVRRLPSGDIFEHIELLLDNGANARVLIAQTPRERLCDLIPVLVGERICTISDIIEILSPKYVADNLGLLLECGADCRQLRTKAEGEISARLNRRSMRLTAEQALRLGQYHVALRIMTDNPHCEVSDDSLADLVKYLAGPISKLRNWKVLQNYKCGVQLSSLLWQMNDMQFYDWIYRLHYDCGANLKWLWSRQARMTNEVLVDKVMLKLNKIEGLERKYDNQDSIGIEEYQIRANRLVEEEIGFHSVVK